MHRVAPVPAESLHEQTRGFAKKPMHPLRLLDKQGHVRVLIRDHSRQEVPCLVSRIASD